MHIIILTLFWLHTHWILNNCVVEATVQWSIYSDSMLSSVAKVTKDRSPTISHRVEAIFTVLKNWSHWQYTNTSLNGQKSFGWVFFCNIYVRQNKRPQIQQRLSVGYFWLKEFLSEHFQFGHNLRKTYAWDFI